MRTQKGGAGAAPPSHSMKAFTVDELSRYTGENGLPAYVAFEGRVYDVTQSFLWQGGRHQAMHHAGCDLSLELNSAPHGEDVIRRFPQVGVLE